MATKEETDFKERMHKAEETLEEIYALMFPESDNYIIPRKISTKLNRDISPVVVLCPTCTGWLGGARFDAIEKMIQGYNNWWREFHLNTDEDYTEIGICDYGLVCDQNIPTPLNEYGICQECHGQWEYENESTEGDDE